MSQIEAGSACHHFRVTLAEDTEWAWGIAASIVPNQEDGIVRATIAATLISTMSAERIHFLDAVNAVRRGVFGGLLDQLMDDEEES